MIIRERPKKRAIVGLALAGLASLLPGCFNDKSEEVVEGRSKGSVFFDETFDNNGGAYHFVGFMNDGKPYAKSLFIDGEDDELQFAARNNVTLGGLEGTAEVVGSASENNDSSIGLNARGSISGTDVGVALEKKVSGGDAAQMSTLYVRGKTDNTKVTAGASDVDGDARGILAATYQMGQNIIGAGVNVNESGEGSRVAVVGRFPEQKGEGFGYRAFVLDNNGVKVVKFLACTRSTISNLTIEGIVSPDGGCLDPAIVANRFDPFSYLWQRTKPGGIVVEGRYSDVFGTQTTELETIYQLPEIRGVSPRVGVTGKLVDDGIGSLSGRVGASFKNGYADVIFSDSDCTVIGGLEVKF